MDGTKTILEISEFSAYNTVMSFGVEPAGQQSVETHTADSPLSAYPLGNSYALKEEIFLLETTMRFCEGGDSMPKK